MSSSTVPRPAADEIDRYIELDALEVLLTSGFALGPAIHPHLHAIDIETEGLDLIPLTDTQSSLLGLFSRVMPDEVEVSREGQLIHARTELTVARLLRSITPELVDSAATYFEGLAAMHLQDAADA